MSDSHSAQDAHDTHDTGEEEHIHMPSPSFAPIVVALGLTFIGFGVVLTPIVLALGVIIFVLGFVVWLVEDMRNASASH